MIASDFAHQAGFGSPLACLFDLNLAEREGFELELSVPVTQDATPRLGKVAGDEACTRATWHRKRLPELREQSLDEWLTPMAFCRGLRAMNAMQQLWSYRRYRNVLFCVTRKNIIEIEIAPLSADKDAWIDRRCHPDSVTSGCFSSSACTIAR
jgi:hypothetical protein